MSKVSKLNDHCRAWPEGSLFNSYYIEVSGRALFLSLDYSTLHLIRTLYCWVLNKEVSSVIFKVFGMTRPGIEPKSPRPLVNTLHTRPISRIHINALFLRVFFIHIFTPIRFLLFSWLQWTWRMLDMHPAFSVHLWVNSRPD